MSIKNPLALPEETVLAGQYTIKNVIGQGGFGITYKAIDRMNGNIVAIKEYFPDALATRVPGKTDVTSFTGERENDFVYGKQSFLQEAETLAKFIGNENIVRIYSYFEEYGTAYFVMEFIEGTNLDDYVKKQGGKIGFDEAADILVPIMDALSVVHDNGIVHRDISPDNIYITNDGKVKLIDFGAARQSLGDKSKSLDIILKHGFAPKEQYLRHGRQGPYTDIYALGATFYYVLTGRRPPDALERADADDIVPPSSLGVKISKAAEDAILMALNVQPQERFQSMSAFKSAMLAIRTEQNKVVLDSSHNTDTYSDASVKPKTGSGVPENIKNDEKRKLPVMALVVVAVLLIVVFGARTLFNGGLGGKAEETTNELKDPYGAITGDWGKSKDLYWMSVTGKKITYSQSFLEMSGNVYQDCNKNKVNIEFDGDSYWFHDTVNDICLVYNPYNSETLNIYRYWDGEWNRVSMIKRISN